MDEELKMCPDCASMNVVHSKIREQLICRDCGLIYQPLAPMMERKFEKTHGAAALGKTKAKKTVKKTAKTVKKAKSAKKTVKAKAKPAKKAAKKPAKKPTKTKRR